MGKELKKAKYSSNKAPPVLMPPPEHLPAIFILHASLQTRCVAKSFGSCKSGKRAEKSCTCSSQWILNSFLATIMSIISHDACSINVAGKCSGGGISTGGALLLEYFKSIKHAYVNFASGTVDYRPPPHYPEQPQLSA